VLIGELRTLATKLLAGRPKTGTEPGPGDARRSLYLLFSRLDAYLKKVLPPDAYERFVVRTYFTSSGLRGAYEHEWELEDPQVPDPWVRLERDVEELLRVLEAFMFTLKGPEPTRSKSTRQH
jgi:hypothetical protein